MPDRFDISPENITPAQIYVSLQSLNNKLVAISLQNELQTKRLDALEVELSGLLSAWKAGGVLLSLAKIVAAVGAAVAAVFAALKFWS